MSPSWEADRSSASQDVPCISWDAKVHFHNNKPPPPLLVMSHASHSNSSRSILILSSHLCLGPPNWLLSLRSPHQSCVCTLLSPMLCWTHILWYDHPNNIWWWTESIKFFVMLASPSPPQGQISFWAPYSWTPSAYVFSSGYITKLPRLNGRWSEWPTRPNNWLFQVVAILLEAHTSKLSYNKAGLSRMHCILHIHTMLWQYLALGR